MKKRILFLASLSLVGCSQISRLAPGHHAQSNQISPACASNSYLKSHDCSVKLVKNKAEQGDADAQYALGYMYYYGSGVKQNKQLGVQWIKRSALQGQVLAKQALPMISRHQQMTALTHPATVTLPVKTAACLKKSHKKTSVTVQMMTSRHLNRLRSEAKRLVSVRKPVHIYQYLSKKGAETYVLTCGHFSSVKQARHFVNQLPAYWKKDQPWVRPVSAYAVKKSIL